MKLLKIALVLFIVVLVILPLNQCTKNTTEIIRDTIQQIQTGNLIGFVSLYDSSGYFIKNRSGVNINIIGTSTYNLISDTNGRFEIDKLQTGTYDINFTKQGFSETKRVGFGFEGGVNPQLITQNLNMPSSLKVILNSLSYIDSQDIDASIQASRNPSTDYSFYRIFYSISDSVSYTNYYCTDSYGPAAVPYNGIIGPLVSLPLYFSSGTKVYVIIYGSPSIYSSYYDITTGTLIYPGLSRSPSKIMSIVIQ